MQDQLTERKIDEDREWRAFGLGVAAAAAGSVGGWLRALAAAACPCGDHRGVVGGGYGQGRADLQLTHRPVSGG